MLCINGNDATIKRVHPQNNGYELIPDSFGPSFEPKICNHNDPFTDIITILRHVVLESFIDLRKYGLYVDSYSYSFLSKEKIINGGIVPVLVSFILSIVILYCFEANIASAVFVFVIEAITVGNSIEMMRNDKWAKSEVERMQSMAKQKSADSE